MEIIQSGSDSDWTYKYKPETGICYSYRAQEHLKVATITRTDIFLNQPIDIFVNSPGQFCTLSVAKLAILQKETYVDISIEVNFCVAS